MVVRLVGENVRGRVEDEMVLLAQRLDIVLHHQASADDFDVDGHPPPVRWS